MSKGDVVTTTKALEALDLLDEDGQMASTQAYHTLLRYIHQQDRRALSHAAGQDGEQCRAASDRAEVAVDLPKIRRLVGPRPMIYMNSFDGQPPCLTLNNACGVIHDLMDEVERLRALSRGVPEDTKDAQRFRDLCELVQAGEWALCEVEITDKYGTVKENWQDGLSDIPQFCDTWASRAASWRKVRTESEQKAAIAAQRKEGEE